jgi:Heavy-metal resistance
VKHWWLVIALLLSVGVNVGVLGIVAANRWGKRAPAPAPGPEVPVQQGGFAPERVVQLADRLGLDGEPRRKFISAQAQFFAETVRLRTEQAEIQRGLRRELMAPRPDRARIDASLQESARAFLEIEKALATNVVESRKLLTPGQDEQFLRFLARLRAAALGAGPGQPARNAPAEGGAEAPRQRRPVLPRPGSEERWQPPQQRPGDAAERPVPPRLRRWQRRFGRRPGDLPSGTAAAPPPAAPGQTPPRREER